MQEVFLSLLSSGLFGTPADTGRWPQAVDWPQVLLMARQQTVSAVVADAIVRLPAHLQPPPQDMAKLRALALRNINSHTLLNKHAAEVVRYLAHHGIPSVLLKGQGIAQDYRNPLMRQCGDIDLYVGERHYARACELALRDLKDEGCETSLTDKHLEFLHAGIPVELHRYAARMHVPWRRAPFSEWCVEQLERDGLPEVELAGELVRVPTIDFNAVFIFYHLWNHFLYGGIGLRQLSDLAMTLHAHRAELDHGRLEQNLRKYGLRRQWQYVMSVLVDHLGLPQDEAPLYTPAVATKADKLLQIILDEGNFGRHGEKARRIRQYKGGYAGRKMNTARNVLGDTVLKMRYDPADKFFIELNRWRIGAGNVIRHYLGKDGKAR